MVDSDRSAAGLEDQARTTKQSLSRFGRSAPDTMSALAQLHKSATREGALSSRVKELMAVGIAVATGCEDCVGYHLEAAARLGATRQEARETLEVAVLMAGGPGSVQAAAASVLVEELPEG